MKALTWNPSGKAGSAGAAENKRHQPEEDHGQEVPSEPEDGNSMQVHHSENK